MTKLYELLFEETISSVADHQSLALLILQRSENTRYYVLYNTNSYNRNDNKFILGFLQTEAGVCNPFMMVKEVAANPGYGALMYEIALSDNPNGLVPDATYVSYDAAQVWQKFKERSDIEVIENLKEICPKYIEHSKENLIEFDRDDGFTIFGIKLLQPIDFDFLLERHDNFVSTRNQEEVEENLAFQGKRFFAQMFKG